MFMLITLFLGLSDVDNEGWWVWSSNNGRLEYSNWDYDEPGGGDKENCASVGMFGTVGVLSKGKWIDSYCSHKIWPNNITRMRAICQST